MPSSPWRACVRACRQLRQAERRRRPLLPAAARLGGWPRRVRQLPRSRRVQHIHILAHPAAHRVGWRGGRDAAGHQQWHHRLHHRHRQEVMWPDTADEKWHDEWQDEWQDVTCGTRHCGRRRGFSWGRHTNWTWRDGQEVTRRTISDVTDGAIVGVIGRGRSIEVKRKVTTRVVGDGKDVDVSVSCKLWDEKMRCVGESGREENVVEGTWTDSVPRTCGQIIVSRGHT